MVKAETLHDFELMGIYHVLRISVEELCDIFFIASPEHVWII